MRTTFLYCRGYIKCIIGNPCAFWEVRSENLSDFSLKRRNSFCGAGVIGSDVPCLPRMSGLECFNMGHKGHGINLYGVSMTLMGN